MGTLARTLSTNQQTGGGLPTAQRHCYTGIMVGLCGILMVFTGFTSAYLVRRGIGGDWQSIPLPSLIWVNTLILLTSSLCLECARRSVQNIPVLWRWWITATALGLTFLFGQGIVWKQLWETGLFLSSNPSSSFFYLFTATHGIHLLGGIVALLGMTLKLYKGRLHQVHVNVMAIYWHFMDGLWIFLLLLFVVGR